MKANPIASSFLKFSDDNFMARLDDMAEIVSQIKTYIDAMEEEIEEMQNMLKDPAFILYEAIEKADVRTLLKLKSLLSRRLIY